MSRTAGVMTADELYRLLHEGDTLEGGDVVPGFTCAIDERFR